MTKIAAFYPNYFHITGIAYAALSVIEAMQIEGVEMSLMGIASGSDLSKPFYKNALPIWSKFIVYRVLTDSQIKNLAEFRYFNTLKKLDIAYLWPAVSLKLYQNLRACSHKMIMESINTHQATSKAILDVESKRLRIRPYHGITLEDVGEESEKLDLVDFVFSCSPAVTDSLLAANIPPNKILPTTYGLRESDILSPSVMTERSNDSEITAIFVGTIGVRKGPHLILDYWCKSKVKGKLMLVGDIEPEVMHIIEPYLRRPDIEHVPYVKDLRAIYKKADVFLLPSFEEGSPLVTYLALGAGLPCIVSPMGAGGVVEHNKEGLVIIPHDAKSWIEALQKISEDVSLRAFFSKNAYAKAKDYLWATVGRKRIQLLMRYLNK